MQQQAIKCMIVGDSMIGKTDLFLTFTTGSPATKYEPTVFDTFTKEILFEDTTYNLALWDSAGDKIYDEVRPISYPHTDCFILCFSINDRSSLKHIESKWKAEIVIHGDGPSVPVILAGLKSDLRDSQEEVVSREEAEELKSQIGATVFLECSTKTKQGVDEIFNQAIASAIRKKLEDDQPPNPVWSFEELKILVIGDSTVGKSSILRAYTSGKPIKGPNHEPTSEVMPHYQDLVLDGTEYFLGIFDIPSAPEYLHDRIKEYQRASGIIILYAVNDPFSFQNVEQQWLPEVREYCPNVPFVIVGNKKDLQKDSEIIIPSVDGEELMLSSGASAFIECSAKTLEGVSDLFIAAVQSFQKSENNSKVD